MPDLLTIDVEDWFHILELNSTPKLQEWDRCESRVEKNFETLLDILEEHHAKATCFFLGWIAEKFPQLVRLASARGHEIASHGYCHQMIYTQSDRQFFTDVVKTKNILQDLIGNFITGYRAPGFSITPQTKWALDVLLEAGYRYDSSLFPAKRGHGYFLNVCRAPFKFAGSNFYEFPISVTDVLGQPFYFFGGGYLRLFPYFIIEKMAERVRREGRPVIYYVHPREIDPGHPRLTMIWKRRFKSYVNLRTMEAKLIRIVAGNELQTMQAFLDHHKAQMPEVMVAGRGNE